MLLSSVSQPAAAVLEHVRADVACLASPMRDFAPANSWIIGGAERRAIIDTGMPGPQTRGLWDEAQRDIPAGSIEAVVGTHMHRDHVGQAGMLAERYGAQFFMGRREYAALRERLARSGQAQTELLRGFLARAGVAEDSVAAARSIDFSSVLVPETAHYLDEGQVVNLGGRDWRVLLGGGHSPEGVTLFSLDGCYAIAGDQILPGSGPHISVWPEEPDDDPLRQYFHFLDRLADVPDTTLVLPGHGRPFTGLVAQTRAIRLSHERRLERVLAAAGTASDVATLATAAFKPAAAAHFGNLLIGITMALTNHLWQAGLLRRHETDAGTLLFEAV